MPQESLGAVTAAINRAYDFRLRALRVRKMDRTRLQHECTTFTIDFLADHFIIPADANIMLLEKAIAKLEEETADTSTKGQEGEIQLEETPQHFARAGEINWEPQGNLRDLKVELETESVFLKRYEDLVQAVVNMNKLDLDWWLQKGEDAVLDTTTAIVSSWNVRVSNKDNQKASQYSTLCAETGLLDEAGNLKAKRAFKKKENERRHEKENERRHAPQLTIAEHAADPDRTDAQPNAGIDAALGDAFNSPFAQAVPAPAAASGLGDDGGSSCERRWVYFDPSRTGVANASALGDELQKEGGGGWGGSSAM